MTDNDRKILASLLIPNPQTDDERTENMLATNYVLKYHPGPDTPIPLGAWGVVPRPRPMASISSTLRGLLPSPVPSAAAATPTDPSQAPIGLGEQFVNYLMGLGLKGYEQPNFYKKKQ